MGSPCELLCEASSIGEARRLAEIAAAEAWRVERKLSRYQSGNIIDEINSSDGKSIRLDDETAHLIDFATTLHELSEGAFDISSGVLRRAWSFDGSNHVPDAATVAPLLDLVGWSKANWVSPVLTLLPGMEVDFGGIGKEYAVDRVVLALVAVTDVSCLVNFGGDLAVTGAPAQRATWHVGIEAIDGSDGATLVELRQGAMATSGDARRFILRDGKRYSHVLDPRTGWPIEEAPSSITVAADTCTQAGMLATLAMLKGGEAESFLAEQSERSWCRRST